MFQTSMKERVKMGGEREVVVPRKTN